MRVPLAIVRTSVRGHGDSSELSGFQPTVGFGARTFLAPWRALVRLIS
ncbi:hypothetical protein ACFQZ4_48830 [Catellatospora coxensis]